MYFVVVTYSHGYIKDYKRTSHNRTQTLTYLQHIGEKTDLPRAASTAQYELVRALPRRGQSCYLLVGLLLHTVQSAVCTVSYLST